MKSIAVIAQIYLTLLRCCRTAVKTDEIINKMIEKSSCTLESDKRFESTIEQNSPPA